MKGTVKIEPFLDGQLDDPATLGQVKGRAGAAGAEVPVGQAVPEPLVHQDLPRFGVGPCHSGSRLNLAGLAWSLGSFLQTTRHPVQTKGL